MTLITEFINLEWGYEFDSPEEAVLAFAARFPDEVPSCVAGIDALLTESPDEAARRQELVHLGWGYASRPGRLDTFLEWAREALSQPSTAATAAAGP
jgi:hypothetical protein